MYPPYVWFAVSSKKERESGENEAKLKDNFLTEREDGFFTISKLSISFSGSPLPKGLHTRHGRKV